jgi:hypothetical protein
MKYFLQFITSIIFILLGKYAFSEHLSPHFIAEGLMILISLIVIEGVYDVYENWDRIYLVIKCRLLAFRKQSIRFSMSYQYRIKIKDKYLLVKNSNFDVYQHVGGKYKRLPSSQAFLQSEFDARDDIKLQTTGLMKDDFAIFIPAGKAIKFLDWFRKGKDREISHWREFYEELIQGKGSVLNPSNFPYVNYNYAGSVITPIKWAAPWKCYEILQFDILDLLPTPAQEAELEQLLAAGDTCYIKWADAELIGCLGHDNREQKQPYRIGAHAKAALNLKWSDE